MPKWYTSSPTLTHPSNCSQNDLVVCGQGLYAGGAAQCTTCPLSISKVFSLVASESTDLFKVTVVFEYVPYTKIGSVPKGTMAFKRSAVASENVLIAIGWPLDRKAGEEQEGDNEYVIKSRKVTRKIAETLREGEGGVGVQGYTNYCNCFAFVLVLIWIDVYCCSLDHEESVLANDKAQSMFEDYPRLQQIKKCYDPENIFHRWFPITPAA